VTPENGRGWTQVELAELVRCGPRFVVELEQGKPTLQWGKVLQVLQGLGIELTATPPDEESQ
jgi:HTH-type transcriptional regulator / antitoxin HipB